MCKEIKYIENSSKGKIVSCYCINCGRKINHEVIMNYQENGSETNLTGLATPNGLPESETLEWKNNYQIIKCVGCYTVSYRSDNWFSAYQDALNNGNYEELFPQVQKRTPCKFKKLPFNLGKIYNESVAAYNTQGLTLCAIGVRCLIEGICNDKEIADENLQKKIDTMCVKAIITPQVQEILHNLRFLGNTAAHELVAPTEAEVEIVLDIIEHILNGIYEIPEKSIVLKSKSINKSNPL